MAFLPNRCGIFNNNSEWVVMSDTDYAAVELYNGYSDRLLVIASVCGVIAMIIGIPGNLITIIALANYKKVCNATAIFIINMSCADLLILCLDPPLATSIYWGRSWTHGRVSCQLYALGKCLLISVSVFTIIAITINRYILIIYPRLYCKIYRTRNMIIKLAAIWICPLLALIPTFLGKWGCFALDLEYGPCSVFTDQNNRSPKKFLFITVLVLPCIPIILCYARIFFVVRKTTKKSRYTAKKARCSNFEETTRHGSSSTNNFTAVTSNDTEEKREYILLETIAKESEHSKESTLEAPSFTNYNKGEEIPESTEQSRIQRNIFKKSMKFFTR
ncbi:G-protein coupled receptor moody-like [Pararge aegeria]|uniref:G-protein coupled receptor moody-like n=1 Tax=Pararge aegeria TaxID=116150 RepID=UPI0019D16AD2|nr:G-protein coupled receptor moody-like [Pararge aegeria]